MSVKKSLSQGLALNRLIEANRRELARLRELAASAGSPDPSRGRGGQGGHADRTGDTATEILGLEEEIKADIRRCVKAKRDARAAISRVGDAELRLVLQKRYLNFEKWEQIARDMSKEMRWVFRLHTLALREAAKKWPNTRKGP